MEITTDYSNVKWQENGKLKLLIIVGTRPEIIRLGAVINKARKYFDCILAHTGQNYDYNLNGIFFKDLKLDERVEIYRNDAFKALKAIVKRELKFDLILLDPPYKGQRINELIEFIHEHELLSPGGIIMAECLKEDELHESVGDIVVCKREVYGITAITIYRRES